MHIVPAFCLGVTVWIGTLAAVPSMSTVLAGPFIVSGVVLAVCLLPWP